MRLAIALALVLASAAGRCETISVPVSNAGWTVRFSLPEQVQMAETPAAAKYYAIGHGSRFNVSLFVGPPTCEGSTTASAAYECMRPKISAVPGVIAQTISVESRTGNVQVSYIQYASLGETKVKVMHTHVLFEKGGLWGDLHASVVRPTTPEIAALLALGEDVEVR
jgi:hypothetical protein